MPGNASGLASSARNGIEPLRTFERIAEVRQQWDRFQWHPEADPNFFRLIVEHRTEVQGPCVMVVRRDGKVEGLLVGRVDLAKLARYPGFTAAFHPKLRILEVIYGGMLGNWHPEHLAKLLTELKRSLARGDWQAVIFRQLSLQSPLWEQCKAQFPGICRGWGSVQGLHWTLRLPGSYDDFCRSLESKTRKNLNRHIRRIEEDFSELEVRRYDLAADLSAIIDTSQLIFSKTYHKGLEKAWCDTEMIKKVDLWLRQGAFQAYFLYLQGKPCAYQHILKYRGRAFGLGTAFDPDYRRYAVGGYIRHKVLEDLCRSGDVSELDFGYGDAEYKREICNHHCKEADLILYGLNWSGLTANAMRTVEIKAVQLLKHALKSGEKFDRLKSAWRESLRGKPRLLQ
jgi:hypothetical protein